MYHPTTRVLTILELLQSHGSMSGPEMAARLEVEQRTVRRYITMLQDMGIPIETTRGPGGGYHLRRGFKLPPLMLTDDEALAITLSLIAARRQGVPADPAMIEGALAKIERVLPESLRTRLQAVQNAVAFVPAPLTPQPASEVLLLISTAVQQQRCLHVCYQSSGEETTRTVDPYGVVFHWDKWYVVGWCHLRESVRLFRLDRILGAILEEATFTRPAEFDSLQYVLDALAMAPRGWAAEVLLKTTLSAAQQQIPPGVAILEQHDTGVLMHFDTDDLNLAARYLILLGCPFVIHRPPELRTAVLAVANEAIAMARK